MKNSFLPQITLLGLVFTFCQAPQPQSEPVSGVIEILDEAAKKIIDPGAGLEVLAEGFEWSEGPVWVENGK